LISRDKSDPATQVERELSVDQIIKRLNMLDERLDNMDSIITSLVERVMEKPLTLEITCPKCGQAIQVNITSNVRLRS
jgi:hypothetical protein